MQLVSITDIVQKRRNRSERTTRLYEQVIEPFFKLNGELEGHGLLVECKDGAERNKNYAVVEGECGKKACVNRAFYGSLVQQANSYNLILMRVKWGTEEQEKYRAKRRLKIADSGEVVRATKPTASQEEVLGFYLEKKYPETSGLVIFDPKEVHEQRLLMVLVKTSRKSRESDIGLSINKPFLYVEMDEDYAESLGRMLDEISKDPNPAHHISWRVWSKTEWVTAPE